MAKRAKATAPREILNEVLAPPPGDPIYRLVLSEDSVEKLAHGRVSRDLMEQAWSMLRAKREFDQAWESYEPCQPARRSDD